MTEKQQQPHKSAVVEHKRVVIHNSHGEELVGLLHETGSRELVILCHGFRSSKDRMPMMSLAFGFEREGISAFRFDFAGNGESQGSFGYGNYSRDAEDLRAVVEHFQAEQRSLVAVIGHSKGGNAVLMYASRHNDIKTIVNIAGMFHLTGALKGCLGKQFGEKIEQCRSDTRAACRTIPPNCRVLTVHGTLDEVVPVENAEEFNKYIPNHNLWLVQGADHGFTKHQSELATIVLNFVKTPLETHIITSHL